MKTPSMKTIVIIIVVGIFVLALVKRIPGSPISGGGDIVSVHRSYTDPTHFTYDASKLPSIGASEAEVYNSLGDNLDRRLTFKATRQKTVAGQAIQYNKILEYSDAIYKTTHKIVGNEAIIDSVPLERADVVIYLLDGKVTGFTGLHATRTTADENYKTESDSVNIDSVNSRGEGQAWPDAQDDIKQYYDENGMEWI